VGASAGQAVIVVAAKFSQIAHVFPQLVKAVGEISGARLVIKPHPAETAAPYLAAARHAPHVAVAPGDADLANLTRIARLLITVNSTAAIEAMVMGVPSLVLAMPNNLTPFVEAGAMSGVFDGDPIGPILQSLLVDEHSRAAVLRGSEAFMTRYRVASDGGAARRAAEHIVRLAATKNRPHGVS
jgi:spore coat polysaccharide biosynthesis predicted glycosyltransferase SpsG